MGYEEFRNIDDLTHEQIIEQEINEIVTKKGEKTHPKPKKEEKETVEQPKEEIKTETPGKMKQEQKVQKDGVKKANSPKKGKRKKMDTPKKVKTKTQTKKKPAKTIIVDDDDKGSQWLTIIVSAIAILAIVVVAYLLFNSVAKPSEQPSTVSALVNGEPIYNSEVNLRLGIMQSQGNLNVSEKDALSETISQKLFVQEAKRQGFKVSRTEVETQLQTELNKSGFTTDKLKANLASQGLDYEDLISFYEDNFLVMQLINETILSKVLISDEDIQDYYQKNKENFRTFETVQIRHILIGFGDKDDNETLIYAQKIKDKISGSRDNFCDLVETYSDDSASIATCGEYNFTKSANLVPEFLEAGFSMDVGEIRIVKTQFGYHIMYKVSEQPSQVAPFDDVKNAIRDILEREYVASEIDKLVTKLRKDAIIEVYKKETTPVVEPVENTTTMPASDSQTRVSVPEEKNDTREIISEPQQTEDIVEVAPPEKEEVVKETVETEKSVKKDLVECLIDKGAKMYTVYWSPDNDAQLELLGDSSDKITVVECDSDKADAKPAECEAAGIKIYPSWVIEGKLLEGTQGTRALSIASGCI